MFDAISTKAVHFTPEKMRQPPRAWERRPATPYIPRDDKQKIWKRVPLGEIGIEPNRPVNISRRDQEATKDYVRVVKKLKVGHGSDDEDKENVSLDFKTDCEDGGIKRKPCVDSRFISMKMEEDYIVGSPKKKLRAHPSERDLSYQENAREEHEDPVEAESDLDGEETEDTIEQDEYEDQTSSNEQESEEVPVGEENAFEDTHLTANVTDVPPGLNACTIDSASSNPRSDASEREKEVTASHRPSEMAEDNAEIQANVTNSTSTEMSPGQTFNTMEPDLPRNDPSHEHDMASQSVDMKPYDATSDKNDQSDEMEVDHLESPTNASEEPRSSSPPTILVENVVVDELESREASKSDTSTADETVSHDVRKEEDSSGSQEMQAPIPRRISDDETTFLRNFVSNSKAERAAREKKAQETLIEEPSTQQQDTSDGPTDLHESFEEAPQVIQGTPTLEPSVTTSAENILSSPLRRSKRAAITSIPRPQALPNAIQLKRANGNEFIFTANKASSAANIAVVTRSNTKRNKGSALTVPERLVQLLADDQGVNENSEVVQADGEPQDNATAETTSKELPTRKRKREAKDGTMRAKKVLRWNDEKLVSYQEAKRFLDDTDDIEDSSQENDLANQQESNEADKHVKLTLTLTSGTGKFSSKDDKDNTSSTPQSKVRRVRRGTSGTVNGTPGPKTRSRRIENDEEKDLNTDVPIDENGSLEDSTAAAAAISDLAATAEMTKMANAKKSRMPMPVSSGLGTRRGAAASASIRSGSAAMRPGASGANEVKKVKEAVTTQVPKEEAKGGDLLGKRRLRVRS